MAASAPVPVTVSGSDGGLRKILVSGDVAYPRAWAALIGASHGSAATIGGQVTPFDGTAGQIPLGRFQTPSGNKPDYSASASDGSTTGDGVLDVAVGVDGRVVSHQAVTGVTGIADSGKRVYLVDDDTLTLTAGAGILGVAVGFILEYEGTGTLCTIHEYSASEIYQQLIEAGLAP